ncbi:hypothetical protein FWH09_00515 [Candidatus Saccharibacteria bacterium]|nr:hypothetical protein [Candidatus Saccharibacteria bacterium]
MRNAKRRIGIGRVFWGMFFLFAATAVILSMLDVVTFGINIGWLLLTTFLAAIAMASMFRLEWFGVFMPVAGILTIGILKTDYLDFIGIRGIWPIWIAAVLLAIGFSILFRRRGKIMSEIIGDDDEVIDHADDEEIEVNVNVGGIIKYVNSDDFRKAYIKCNVGGVKVYFDNAKIKGKSATIEISGMMSGIKLYVPKEWKIVNEVNCTAAGIEEKNKRADIDAKKEKMVYLKGSLTAAGAEIVYI